MIPATTIYYEDNFVKLDILDSSGNVVEGAKWDTESAINNRASLLQGLTKQKA